MFLQSSENTQPLLRLSLTYLNVERKFQSFEDIHKQGKQLYFWSDTFLESYLRDNFGPGTAAHELYKSGRGLSSTKEMFDVLKTDKGLVSRCPTIKPVCDGIISY